MWRVKRNEDKKAGKKEGKGARGNLERFKQKRKSHYQQHRTNCKEAFV